MCGLAGILRYGGAGPEEELVVDAMLDAVERRGPDERGTRSVEPHLAMGATRFTVTVPGSSQPLEDERGALLTFNGEIYNFRELRAGLERRGHRFQGGGEAEVLLRLYREHGLDFAEQLDGMFAIALWDPDVPRLVLARDPLGIKPLCYWVDDDTLVFASELGALCRHPAVPVQVDPHALATYLLAKFVVPPRSILAGVTKLEPGTLLVAEPDGRRHVHYRSAHAGESAERGLGDALAGAVASCADTPHRPVVLLSGGLDSSAVATLAPARSLALSVGYSGDAPEDERDQAASVARAAGIEQVEVTVDDDDVEALLSDAIRALEEPVFTPVVVSTLAVARAAAELTRVALGGDGADELLVGYDHMRGAHRAACEGRDWRTPYTSALGWLDDATLGAVAGELLAETGMDRLALLDEVPAAGDPAEHMRSFELRAKLPEYHFTRVDRLSMHEPVEVRVPFARAAVADWALGRPAAELAGAPTSKEDLRDLLRGRVPESIRSRPKQKFSAPYRRWLSGPLRDAAADVLADGLGELGLEPAAVAAAAGRDDAATWGLLVLGLWQREVLAPLRRRPAVAG